MDFTYKIAPAIPRTIPALFGRIIDAGNPSAGEAFEIDTSARPDGYTTRSYCPKASKSTPKDHAIASFLIPYGATAVPRALRHVYDRSFVSAAWIPRHRKAIVGTDARGRS